LSKTISPFLIAHRRSIRLARLGELLAETRALDFDAYVSLRAQMSVFDLIEIEGEREIKTLCERGNFRREEVTLLRS
jgi:hypothetical protein